MPVLWDKKKGTIVNNESSEIIRMLNRQEPRQGGAARQGQMGAAPSARRVTAKLLPAALPPDHAPRLPCVQRLLLPPH